MVTWNGTCGSRLAWSIAVLACGITPPAAGQGTTRISVGASGSQGNTHSGELPTLVGINISMSEDGRHVAFLSAATNLVAPDTNGQVDVFVHDRLTGTTALASVATDGTQGNLGSFHPAISADGRFVAFMSNANNLVGGDTNGSTDVFVRDRKIGTTERVSVDAVGTEANSACSFPAISSDGRFVAFAGIASNLVSGDTNGLWDVFLRDRLTGTNELVSVDSTGAQGNGDSWFPSVSADGRFVAFQTLANLLAGWDGNGVEDVYVRDRLNGTIQLMSSTTGGSAGNALSLYPELSDDGRFVVFHSRASDLVALDTNGNWDSFVRDIAGAATELVNIDANGVQGTGLTANASISADGRHVVFMSHADIAGAGDTNGVADVFLRDRLNGTIEVASRAANGALGNSHSNLPSVSADGRFVAFASFSSNLVALDTNGTADVFVRERWASRRTFCFGDGLDATHTTQCPCGGNGAPGNGCANSVSASGARLTPLGPLTGPPVLSGSGMPSSSTCIYLQGDALTDEVFGDGVRCTGGTLIRLRTRTNVGGASSFPDSTDTVTLAVRGGVVPGSGVRRYYQTYYGNAAPLFCPPATFNVTNGVIVDW